ncbi:cytochrome P450 [Marasmius fiardii PR-910]|nr:cytochrome P450 [Marasmius fiardii PR-910]
MLMLPDIFFFLVFATILGLWFRRPSRYSYPPGPKPFPILGNITDFTIKEPWLTATEWGRKFGDICYLHVLNWNVIFLNSLQAADDLLEKRGATYSDRPTLQMSGELCGVEKIVALAKYDEVFKRQRRYVLQTLGPRIIPNYHSMIEAETVLLLHALVMSPSEYLGHIRKYAGGLALSVVYGYRPISTDDEFLVMAEECLSILANEIANRSGIWPVDVFPILKYVPSWFPGGGFKKKAAVWKVKMREFADAPFEHAKSCAEDGTIMPSFCSKLLSGEELDERTEDEIKWSANSMFAASSDANVTSVSQFFLAMLQYPEIMKKAQEEIDRVVGTDRLPNFSDRDSLPYVEALMLEVWRWGAPTPINLPHYTTQDDVYNGYFIPKNTIVIANMWAMLRDEAMFPNPDVFDPQRFLSIDSKLKAKRDPRNSVFGFGRRRCPGSDLVDSSIWLLLVSILATLSINKAVDKEGKVIEPDIKYNNSIFRMPDKFVFDVKPRSLKASSLIHDGAEAL